jgi:2-dehydro-3-deoxyphosphogluconate aldolase/(4S)-4-hydroxy-2-oxoglutarate aldolase
MPAVRRDPKNLFVWEDGEVTDVLEATLKPREPIVIVRLDDLSGAVDIGKALLAGGVKAIEFALTNGRAVGAIHSVRDELADNALVGAGTVLDAKSAREAISAGAQFLVTPVLRKEVIEVGGGNGVSVLCGAYSPTEIFDAHEAGADPVKVFPARLLGPAYVKDVLAPLPDLKLVPTGGVNLDNCAAFLEAGAYTVAVGSSLVDEALVARRDWVGLSALAGRYVKACAEGGGPWG